MGCIPTKKTPLSMSKLTGFKGTVPFVTFYQKKVLLESWAVMMQHISRVGVITFMRLFETHPDLQEIFIPLRGLNQDQLRNSKELRTHALRVMGFVQKAVARLDHPQKLEELLGILGKSHIAYGAKAEYLEKIGPQFIYAVKPSMGNFWNEEVEHAWLQLFRYITHYMRVTMLKSGKEVT